MPFCHKIPTTFSIQFFLYHVDLVVYVIQRIMIVQAGPAFLQFP